MKRSVVAYAVTFSTLIGLMFACRKEHRIAQERNLLKGQDEAHQASLLQVAAEKKATVAALQHTGAKKLLTIMRKKR